MNTKNIVIVGAGQNGFVIKGILEHDKLNNVVGFLDDKISGPHIHGTARDFKKFIDHSFFVAIGNNAFRRETYEMMKSEGAKFVNAVHPTAFVEKSVSIGENVMVGAFSYLNVNSTVGDDTFVNNGCIVEHDCKIGRHSHLTPGVVMGGGVVIGDNVFVGLGSSIRDHISIGEGATIGMGSVVLGDVAPNVLFHNRLDKVVK